MPIYEYRCANCGTDFELARPMSQSGDPASCPNCKRPAQKLVSSFASKADYAIKVPAKEPFRAPATAAAAPAAKSTASGRQGGREGGPEGGRQGGRQAGPEVGREGGRQGRPPGRPPARPARSRRRTDGRPETSTRSSSGPRSRGSSSGSGCRRPTGAWSPTTWSRPTCAASTRTASSASRPTSAPARPAGSTRTRTSRSSRDHGGQVVVDGDNGDRASWPPSAPTRSRSSAAREHGMAGVALRRSNHCGAMAYYAIRAMPRGLIGFATPTPASTWPPTGGAKKLVGNNPFAMAVPTKRDGRWCSTWRPASSPAASSTWRVEGRADPARLGARRRRQPDRRPGAARDGLAGAARRAEGLRHGGHARRAGRRAQRRPLRRRARRAGQRASTSRRSTSSASCRWTSSRSAWTS